MYSLILDLNSISADSAVIRADKTSRFEKAHYLIGRLDILGGERLRIDVNELLGAYEFSGAVSFAIFIRCNGADRNQAGRRGNFRQLRQEMALDIISQHVDHATAIE